ncbi:MAG TPA: hypothetical protein VNO56_04125 [Gaiellaceae bacterium]|nr:hypothetical protein [Gaiellaceae bacterium]
MRRRRLLVPLLLALSGLGWAAAHAIAHQAVMPGGEQLRQSSLQAYLGYVPSSLALCLALALALAAGAALGLRWRRASGRSLWMFGVVPVLGFAGHALAEPLIAGSATLASTVSRGAALTPVLVVGLLVQIPFALVAVALASGILRAAEGLARVLAAPAVPLGRREPERHEPAPAARAPAFRLDRAHGQRAPPVLHLA